MGNAPHSSKKGDQSEHGMFVWKSRLFIFIVDFIVRFKTHFSQTVFDQSQRRIQSKMGKSNWRK